MSKPREAQPFVRFEVEDLLLDSPERAVQGQNVSQVGEGVSVSPVSVHEACTGHSGEECGGPEEGDPGETRVCLCGVAFRVNPRHASAHRYCSSRCRSKARHERKRTRGLQAPAPPEGILPELAMPEETARVLRRYATWLHGSGAPRDAKPTHE